MCYEGQREHVALEIGTQAYRTGHMLLNASKQATPVFVLEKRDADHFAHAMNLFERILFALGDEHVAVEAVLHGSTNSPEGLDHLRDMSLKALNRLESREYSPEEARQKIDTYARLVGQVTATGSISSQDAPQAREASGFLKKLDEYLQ